MVLRPYVESTVGLAYDTGKADKYLCVYVWMYVCMVCTVRVYVYGTSPLNPTNPAACSYCAVQSARTQPKYLACSGMLWPAPAYSVLRTIPTRPGLWRGCAASGWGAPSQRRYHAQQHAPQARWLSWLRQPLLIPTILTVQYCTIPYIPYCTTAPLHPPPPPPSLPLAGAVVGLLSRSLPRSVISTFRGCLHRRAIPR